MSPTEQPVPEERPGTRTWRSAGTEDRAVIAPWPPFKKGGKFYSAG